eukprot:1180363-Prymnesium_polylepis.1
MTPPPPGGHSAAAWSEGTGLPYLDSSDSVEPGCASSESERWRVSSCGALSGRSYSSTSEPSGRRNDSSSDSA